MGTDFDPIKAAKAFVLAKLYLYRLDGVLLMVRCRLG